MTPEEMDRLATRVDQFADHYRAKVVTLHDLDDGDKLPLADVLDAMAEIYKIAAEPDVPTLFLQRLAYLNNDGKERVRKVDGADREQVERALLYTAGELVALQNAMSDTVMRGVTLIRHLDANTRT